jgi:hypothetical protein
MLLLMLQTKNNQRPHRLEAFVVGVLYEPKDCGIDVLTIPVHFIQCWACEQPSLGPRMATSQGLVVRIEQVQIRRVEGLA